MSVVIKDKVTYKGKPIVLQGENELCLGDKIPDLRLAKGMEEDLNLDDLKGMPVAFNVIPSIDTPVCAKSTKIFNDQAGKLAGKAAVVTVSMDLPFAIQRWCQAERVENVHATSDYKYQDFGKNFSVMMRGLGLLARSIWVMDGNRVLQYREIVPKMEDEPDYDKALEAIHNHLPA